MTPTIKFGTAIAAILLIALVGFGVLNGRGEPAVGGPPATPSSIPSPSPSPTPSVSDCGYGELAGLPGCAGPLTAGEHRSTNFDPAVTFQTPDGWENNVDIPAEPGLGEYTLPPTIISMDPPRHGVYRQLLSRRFTPRALRALEADIERIGGEIVDELGRDGLDGECDFVERVAMPLPIAVIAWLLGVPREDWGRLFDWTNRLAGPTDPEYRQAGEHAGQTRARANAEIFGYFERLLEEGPRLAIA